MKYDFDYLKYKEISLYSESEEDRESFINICYEFDIDVFPRHNYKYFHYGQDYKSFENEGLARFNIITFKQWVALSNPRETTQKRIMNKLKRRQLMNKFKVGQKDKDECEEVDLTDLWKYIHSEVKIISVSDDGIRLNDGDNKYLYSTSRDALIIPDGIYQRPGFKPKEEYKPYTELTDEVKDNLRGQWIRDKTGKDEAFIGYFSQDCIFLDGIGHSLLDLFTDWTFLDGTPIGEKVK